MFTTRPSFVSNPPLRTAPTASVWVFILTSRIFIICYLCFLFPLSFLPSFLSCVSSLFWRLVSAACILMLISRVYISSICYLVFSVPVFCILQLCFLLANLFLSFDCSFFSSDVFPGTLFNIPHVYHTSILRAAIEDSLCLGPYNNK